MAARTGFRAERDSLGEKMVPVDAYYGVQTQRASENFAVSGRRASPGYIVATAMVKLASARANESLGLLDKKKARAIARAASEIIEGRLHDQFIVDAFQAGAGTSHNMNANEVIANRAAELLGRRRGVYSIVHPNDHVNMSQSTNDVIPTAMRLAALEAAGRLLAAVGRAEKAFRRKSMEFRAVMKSGRTHLRDAVPMTLGQEFGSYASAMRTAGRNIEAALAGIKRVALGATAVGTGINTHARYRRTVLAELRKASGVKGLRMAEDPFEALAFSTDFAALSGAVRLLAADLVKISGDLRLLSSGPRTGLGEISLPAVQPGSSIMPGKVNPAMAEMLSMACFHAMGADHAVAMAAQAGQLELNVMTPVIAHNLLSSVDILTSALDAFTERCASGIRADRERCARHFESSVALATALNVFIGYEKAAEVARESARTGRTIREVVLERGIMKPAEWSRLMSPGNITRPADLRAAVTKGKKRR